MMKLSAMVSDHIPPMVDGAKENMRAIGRGEDCFSKKTFTASRQQLSQSNEFEEVR
jgi:hypothetical protein